MPPHLAYGKRGFKSYTEKYAKVQGIPALLHLCEVIPAVDPLIGKYAKGECKGYDAKNEKGEQFCREGRFKVRRQHYIVPLPHLSPPLQRCCSPGVRFTMLRFSNLETVFAVDHHASRAP